MRVNNTFIYHTTPTFRRHAHYPYPKYFVISVHSCLSINLNQIQTNVFIYLPVYHLSYTSITPAQPIALGVCSAGINFFQLSRRQRELGERLFCIFTLIFDFTLVLSRTSIHVVCCVWMMKARCLCACLCLYLSSSCLSFVPTLVFIFISLFGFNLCFLFFFHSFLYHIL